MHSQRSLVYALLIPAYTLFANCLNPEYVLPLRCFHLAYTLCVPCLYLVLNAFYTMFIPDLVCSRLYHVHVLLTICL